MFRSIRFKLSGFVFLLLLLTTVLFSFVTLKIMNQTISNEIIKRAESLAKSSASIAAFSLISKDTLGLDNIVFKGKGSNLDIEYMAVVDRDKRVLAHNHIKMRGEILRREEGSILRKSQDGTVIKEITLPSGKVFEIESPIFFKDKLLGMVILGINQSVLLEAQRLARYRILWLLVIILLTGLIGTLGLSFFLTRPIRELASGVEKLKEGMTSRPLRIFSKDELGKLTESFNRMSELITEQQGNLIKYTQELEEAYVSSLRVLALAIDARDSYTLGHSTRVVFNASIIGEEIGLNQEELKELEIAALFHDVGKLKTPDAILLKKWSLSSKEYDEMRQHPEDGAEILGKVKSLQKYVSAVRHHHEHYDGKGYPDGLRGDRIPLFAAIIAIADTFDAMTSTRPYRRALSGDEALKELEKRAGKQFHPDLVRAFLRALENGKQPSLPSYLKKVI